MGIKKFVKNTLGINKKGSGLELTKKEEERMKRIAGNVPDLTTKEQRNETAEIIGEICDNTLRVDERIQEQHKAEENLELGKKISDLKKEIKDEKESFLENRTRDENATKEVVDGFKKRFDELEKEASTNFQEDLEEMGETLDYMLSHFKPF